MRAASALIVALWFSCFVAQASKCDDAVELYKEGCFRVPGVPTALMSSCGWSRWGKFYFDGDLVEEAFYDKNSKKPKASAHEEKYTSPSVIGSH